MAAEAQSFVCAAALLIFPLAAVAEERGITLGAESTSQWRFGVVVTATGAMSSVRATLPVPMEWPEQTFKKIAEDKSPGTEISYRTLEAAPGQPGVRQMSVFIPRLAPGEQATAVVTYEITKRRIEAPSETSVYQIKAPPAGIIRFLNPSPYIESKDAKIKSLAAEITAGKELAWDKASAIFDWVRGNIKYEFAEEIKPTSAALKAEKGDCEELSSLVIAMCRASKIPARAVWIPGHTYPEFYLTDDQNKGHWFPCQAAGADRQFGSMIEDRPILQKGDNFTVPGDKAPQRYVKQKLTAKDAAAPPKVKFIMEPVKQ
ncbi:MAG TPA: transglutaminase-like domain-containing protein [Pirellulaceae bacterium]|jgi:hypothetical protein